MGLDWRPLHKPLPGKEKEFEDRFLMLTGKKEIQLSLLDKLTGGKEKAKQKLLEDFLRESITPYATLKAPQVGIDDDATEWAKGKFENRSDKSQTMDQFLESMHGYYVVDLVEEHAGKPVYIAMHDEPHIFRAKFLEDCVDIIGQEILDEAFTTKLARDSADYAKRLITIADDYAGKHNCQHLKNDRVGPEFDEESPESKSHILYSAANWLLWWSERGHGYEADF